MSSPKDPARDTKVSDSHIPPEQAFLFPWQGALHTDIPHPDSEAHDCWVHYRTMRSYLSTPEEAEVLNGIREYPAEFPSPAIP